MMIFFRWEKFHYKRIFPKQHEHIIMLARDLLSSIVVDGLLADEIFVNVRKTFEKTNFPKNIDSASEYHIVGLKYMVENLLHNLRRISLNVQSFQKKSFCYDFKNILKRDSFLFFWSATSMEDQLLVLLFYRYDVSLKILKDCFKASEDHLQVRILFTLHRLQRGKCIC